MHNKLDYVDVKILEGLAENGPRNVTRLAKQLGIPRGTVISRIKRMSTSFYLRLVTNIYHTNLGMKKGVVYAKARPGQEDLLLDCMKINKFYIYLSRCFGTFEGCIGIYVIPVKYTAEFEAFVQDLKSLGVAENIILLWSTCFHTVNRTTVWFDSSCEEWIFPWDDWLEEIFSEPSELPYTLKDPESFTLKADKMDLLILKEMEKDATITLAEIARKLGTTLQNICYHFKRHIIQNGLIEDFQIAILPFERSTSDMLFFTFRFDNVEKMSKFAQSLLDKPFIFIVGKVLGKTTLLSQVYLPRIEFRNFIDALSKLARENFLESYDYVFQDLRPGRWIRETIPYQLFEGGSWIYRHEEHIENLYKLVMSQKT
jgi:DNA-binding Lrp family transcriptional regulator